MKIGKVVLWSVTIGVFVILLVAAAVTYNRQQTEQEQLRADIAQAELHLGVYTGQPGQKEELEAKIGQVEARIITVQGELSGYTRAKSIEINEILFQAAYDTNVTIVQLNSSVAEPEKEIGGITYGVFSLNIVAKGDVLPELLNFSKKVSDKFPTATITSAAIAVSGKPTINLKLSIYAYESK